MQWVSSCCTIRSWMKNLQLNINFWIICKFNSTWKLNYSTHPSWKIWITGVGIENFHNLISTRNFVFHSYRTHFKVQLALKSFKKKSQTSSAHKTVGWLPSVFARVFITVFWRDNKFVVTTLVIIICQIRKQKNVRQI